jgi:hypothetical protein
MMSRRNPKQLKKIWTLIDQEAQEADFTGAGRIMRTNGVPVLSFAIHHD